MIHSMPQVIGIEVSRGCNRNCSYCPKSKLPELMKPWRMPLWQFRHILHNLSDSGVQDADINLYRYSEPLMDHVRPFLPEYIALAKQTLPDCAIWVYTNGDYLTPEVKNSLDRAGIDGLVVTDHGGLNIPWYHGKIWKSRDLVFSDRAGTMDFQSSFYPLHQFKTPLSMPCYEPVFRAEIHKDGQVGLCCEDGKGLITFGNVLYNRFDSIWFSEKYKNVRRLLMAGNRNHGICKNCRNFITAHPQLLRDFHCAMQSLSQETPREVVVRFVDKILLKSNYSAYSSLILSKNLLTDSTPSSWPVSRK